MRSKLVLAALIFLTTLPGLAQVAPAARIRSIPLGVGAGLSDFDTDYGSGRMLGASAWIDYNLFHGLGVEAEGTSIFADKPASLTRMEQDSIKGGAIYKPRAFYGLHPYVKGLYGIGKIQFPSHNPLYTEDSFATWAMGAGVEYKLWRTVYARGEWEYQAYENFFGSNTLNPNGFTIGAMYYLRGAHGHR